MHCLERIRTYFWWARMGDHLPEIAEQLEQAPQKITIQVRGTTFEIPWNKLQNHPKCRITLDALEQNTQLKYNRNAFLFESILDFLLYDQLHLPAGACWRAFQREMKFWQISEDHLSHCCWDQFMKTREQDSTIEAMKTRWYRHQEGLKDYELYRKSPVSFRKLRRSIWMLVSEPDSSRAAMVSDNKMHSRQPNFPIWAWLPGELVLTYLWPHHTTLAGLFPILTKIELMCQQPAMPQLSGVQVVASQPWGAGQMAGGSWGGLAMGTMLTPCLTSHWCL